MVVVSGIFCNPVLQFVLFRAKVSETPRVKSAKPRARVFAERPETIWLAGAFEFYTKRAHTLVGVIDGEVEEHSPPLHFDSAVDTVHRRRRSFRKPNDREGCGKEVCYVTMLLGAALARRN